MQRERERSDIYLSSDETVAPLTIVGNTSLLAISTLTSEINFYTRLLRMKVCLLMLATFLCAPWEQFPK